jgi:hypothetical protein
VSLADALTACRSLTLPRTVTSAMEKTRLALALLGKMTFQQMTEVGLDLCTAVDLVLTSSASSSTRR